MPSMKSNIWASPPWKRFTLDLISRQNPSAADRPRSGDKVKLKGEAAGLGDARRPWPDHPCGSGPGPGLALVPAAITPAATDQIWASHRSTRSMTQGELDTDQACPPRRRASPSSRLMAKWTAGRSPGQVFGRRWTCQHPRGRKSPMQGCGHGTAATRPENPPSMTSSVPVT